MTSHDDMLDNVAAYALGSLSSDQAAAVAKHLLDCEQCHQEYRALRPAVTAVAYAAEACADAASGTRVASPLLKARIMKQVRSEAARPRRLALRPPYAALAAACVVLAIVSGVLAVALNHRVGADRAQLARQAAIISDLASSRAQHHPFAHGNVVVTRGRLYVTVHDLPAPPAGKVYQTWTLARGAKTVAPSVTFTPDKDGSAIVPIPADASSVVAVAISLEPSGGSKAPTTKPIAFVKIGS
jgi:anti-sigma-K factor RskA